jgi:hypothetical protein
VKWLVFIDRAADIDHVFGKLDIPLDCELLVAQQVGQAGQAGQADQVLLTELYRVDSTEPLLQYRLGNWSSAGGFVWSNATFTERRGNLQQFLVYAAAFRQVSWYRRKILSQGGCMSA